MAPTEGDRDDEGRPSLPQCGDAIDPTTFEQILEMDDDDGRDFSREIVFGFFEQAQHTFVEMDEAMERRDLEKLSSLGHYLKGSSATLGLNKVRDHCEKIQHLGSGKNEAGDPADYDEDVCFNKIAEILPTLKHDFQDAEKRLREYYDHFPIT